MSYDLAVWEGRRPFLGRGAGQSFDRLMDELESEPNGRPPSPAMADFVRELLALWPDLGEPGDERSPWAAGPLMEEASGSFIYFGMTFDAAKHAVPIIGRVARRRRLVCYDPQSERLV